MPTNIPQFSVPDILAVLRNLEGRPYEDEGVDQLQHALQTAQQARRASSDPETVTAALMHDIGRAPGVAEFFSGIPHEQAGAEFCRQHFGDRVAYVVGQHVPAKRYLVAVDTQYARSLSPASQRSLERQGGPMTVDEVAQFDSHPWAQDATRLRRWDDIAKAPGAGTDSLDSYARDLDRVWLTELDRFHQGDRK